MARIDYFSPARIALNAEITYHPELMKLLANHPAGEFEVKLAEIATYCDVILDGEYTQKDIDVICERLIDKLYNKRTGLILPMK